MEANHPYEHDLATRYLTGELEAEDLRRFSAWLAEEESHQAWFREFEANWARVMAAHTVQAVDTSKEWEALAAKLGLKEGFAAINPEPTTGPASHNKRLAMFPAWLKVAAILVLLLGSVLLFRQLSGNDHQILIAGTESILGIQLPDGTVVDLARGSSLEYPGAFDGNLRQVRITGKAFFQVAHDHTKPFIVSVGELRIEVLGTRFLVDSDPDNQQTEVFLESGKVRLSYENQTGKTLILQPGQEAMALQQSGDIQMISNPLANRMAWKTKDFQFEESPISEVLEVLEEVYVTDIQVEGERILACRLTARFSQQDLPSVLKVISQTLGLGLVKRGKVYVLTGPGCP